MKKIKFYVCLMLSCLFSFTACDDEFKDETYVLYDMQPASTYLSDRSEDFSEWIKIMKYADLYNAVNVATQYFTLFVPNNQAVTEFYAKKGVSSIEELGEEYAKTLVRFHVINDTINQETFISTDGDLETQTLSEDYLNVSYGTGNENAGGLQSLYLNKEAHVVELANHVSNGYVYVLENVMTPLTESVYDRIQEESEYGIFKTALDETKLGARIHEIYENVPDANGKVTQQKRNYTVLAVTDATFQAEGIADFNGLANRLGAGTDYTNPENALYKYVAYHIISGMYSLSRMQQFDTEGSASKLWNTLSNDYLIKTSEEGDGFYLNYDNQESRSQFVEDNCDIKAKNGYIHQLSSCLWVTEQKPESVLFDLCDFEEIANAIAAGKADANCVYQTVGSSEGWLDCTELDIYQSYAPNPSSWRPGTCPDGLLNYMNAKSSNDWQYAQNHDYLVFNVGYMGWFSVQTPTILKGKYKVSIQFGHAKSIDFIAKASDGSNGGQMDISFDDKVITCYPYTSDHKTGNSYNFSYEVGEWEFDSTASHTFKLTLKDPTASKNSNYRMYIDYILFEPVTEE